MTSIRRTEISAGDSIGVVFEPEEGSDQFVVMLSGASGGFPEAPAKRLAENGFTSFPVVHELNDECCAIERWLVTLARLIEAKHVTECAAKTAIWRDGQMSQTFTPGGRGINGASDDEGSDRRFRFRPSC